MRFQEVSGIEKVSFSVSGVMTDKVHAQWKATFDASTLNDFSARLSAATKEVRNVTFKYVF